MAKAKQNTVETVETVETIDNGNLVAVYVPAGLILKAHGFECNVETASAKTLAYCMQNGFSQSLTDAAAMAKEDKEGKTDDEIKALVAEKRQARFDAIMSGSVGTRVGGPRAVGIDKFIKLVATEWVKAWAASKGKKLPDGKGAAEKLQAIIDSYMADEGRASKVRAEAQKRMDAASDAADFDFDTAA